MKPLVSLLSLLLACAAFADASRSKPNIVFIIGDDCGYNEFSFQGGRIPTPRIDSIAAGGVRLTQGYVSAAICSPSRAGLLTGRYQQRFGYPGNPPMKRLDVEGVPTSETLLPSAPQASRIPDHRHREMAPRLGSQIPPVRTRLR